MLAKREGENKKVSVLKNAGEHSISLNTNLLFPPSLLTHKALSLSPRVPPSLCLCLCLRPSRAYHPQISAPSTPLLIVMIFASDPFLRSLAYRPQISNTRPDSVCLSLYPFSCPRLACSVSQQSLSLSSVSKPAQTCNRPNEVVPVVVAVAAPVALPAALLLASLFEYSAPAMLKAKFCGAARSCAAAMAVRRSRPPRGRYKPSRRLGRYKAS